MENKDLKDNSKLTRFEFAFLIIVAIVTITIVSACSPLYPFNPWEDTNCFFTLGRGIIHGLVPYRDLYEQKGPLLYFLYAFAALLSEKSFVGAWILECVAATVYAVYSWKIAKLFAKPSKFCIFFVPLLLAGTYTLLMFNFGGNAEELCFPLLSIALYTGLRSLVVLRRLPSNSEALLCGILSAVLFWIKYTFLGFMAGFVICILFFALKHKLFGKLWSLVWRFILGFVFFSVPILIYFQINNALGSLWEAYFYNNMFLYLGSAQADVSFDIPLIKYICIPIVCLIKSAELYPVYGMLFLFSVISPIFASKTQRKTLYYFLGVTLLFASAFVFTKVSVLYYYGYILSYSFALILIPVIKCINKLESKIKKKQTLLSVAISIILTVLYFMVLFTSKNMYLIFKPKEYLSQFRISETVNQTPDAKILTYDVMDCGFYTASGLLPANRYYCYLIIESDYPAIKDEQNSLIAEGYFDYIITTYNCECDWKNYDLIQKEKGQYNDQYGNSLTEGYKLYKRDDS